MVAVDGKRLRGSYDTSTHQPQIHLVSAWASAQSVALGQLKVADHTNEIPAIPQLLEVLDISGCIVTTDAMGCQTQNGKKGSPKELTSATIEKMLRIYRFLFAQDQPVYRAAIQRAVGFDITRSLMNQRSRSLHTITLESLGIVERLPGERTWCAWQLTELGRIEGDAIIEGLNKKSL